MHKANRRGRCGLVIKRCLMVSWVLILYLVGRAYEVLGEAEWVRILFGVVCEEDDLGE